MTAGGSECDLALKRKDSHYFALTKFSCGMSTAIVAAQLFARHNVLEIISPG